MLVGMLCMNFTAIGWAATNAKGLVQLTWEELIPASGKGTPLILPNQKNLKGQPDRKTFDGNDEDYQYLLDSMEDLRYSQPQGADIRTELDGKQVRIPGYIAPLTFNEEEVTEFLLVPYHGACIHVPPPPGNQIIYVKNAKGLTDDMLYGAIWVTGKLSAKPVGTILADAGYQIDGAKIEPYEE